MCESEREERDAAVLLRCEIRQSVQNKVEFLEAIFLVFRSGLSLVAALCQMVDN